MTSKSLWSRPMSLVVAAAITAGGASARGQVEPRLVAEVELSAPPPAGDAFDRREGATGPVSVSLDVTGAGAAASATYDVLRAVASGTDPSCATDPTAPPRVFADGFAQVIDGVTVSAPGRSGSGRVALAFHVEGNVLQGCTGAAGAPVFALLAADVGAQSDTRRFEIADPAGRSAGGPTAFAETVVLGPFDFVFTHEFVMFASFGVSVAGDGAALFASSATLVGFEVEDTDGGAVAGAQIRRASSPGDLVQLVWFTAEREDGGVRVRWATGAEMRCGSFALLRCALERSACAAAADHVPVGERRCQDAARGATYDLLDDGAAAGAGWSYLLREHATTGGVNHYGPLHLPAGSRRAAWDPETGLSSTSGDAGPPPPAVERETRGATCAAAAPASAAPLALLLVALAAWRRGTSVGHLSSS